MKTVKIVIGANFGDEGKGLMTDYFASKNNNSIAVMHNGGAQRGHTVVTPEGIRHVFHHFSAGTYAGAATYLSKDFIVNPVLFRQEYEKLVKHGVKPKVFINPRCKLTTIYDMLINQVIEADRGADKHGSCGVGVFETLYRNQHGIDFKNKFEYNPLKMEVQEFEMFNFIGQISFLDCVRKEYVPKRFDVFGLKNISVDFLNVLNSDNAIINFIDDYRFMRNHSEWANDDIIEKYDNVIFENAQGLLLDQHNMDYFPQAVTYAMGTVKNNEHLDKYFRETKILEKKKKMDYENVAYNIDCNTPLSDVASIFQDTKMLARTRIDAIIIPQFIKEIKKAEVIDMSNTEMKKILEETNFTPDDTETLRKPWLRKRYLKRNELLEIRKYLIDYAIKNINIKKIRYGIETQAEDILKCL